MTKHSHIGALWSAFVIPGAGQFVLKRYFSALFYAIVSIASLSVIIAQVIKIAREIAELIKTDAIHAQESGFMGAVASGWKTADTSLMSSAFILFLVIWLLSILDAYRVGASIDKKSQTLL